MARRNVAGFGGIVLFADHADALMEWYQKHFDLFFQREPGSHAWRCDVDGMSFAIHQARTPRGTDRRQVEITWRVTDLDALLEKLSELGISVDEKQETPTGDYAWLDDLERNRLELWQRRE